MKNYKNIIFFLYLFLSLLIGNNSADELFEIIPKKKIRQFQIDSSGILTNLNGELTPSKKKINLKDIEIFCASIEKYLTKNKFYEDFEFIKSEISNLGTQHYYFQQTFMDVPVEGRFLKLHSNIHGQLSSFSNDYQNLDIKEINPKLSKSEIKLIARRTVLGEIQREINPELIIYTFNSKPKLAFKVKIVSRFDSKIVIVDANTGEIINTFSLIFFDGPTLGSGENLLGEWIDSLFIYEGNDFPGITGGLSYPNLFCEEYCWDYGDCDGESYEGCNLSYDTGDCPDGYILDCDNECTFEEVTTWALGNGVCDDPDLYVDEDSIQSGNFNLIDASNTNREPIFTVSSYGNYYTDLFFVNSESPAFESDISSHSHRSGVSSHDYHKKTLDYFESFGFLGMNGTGLRLANIIGTYYW